VAPRAGKSIGERILGLVTEVRPGEAATALLMTLNGFVLLAAYACIKPVREALILTQRGGPEFKIYMAGATALVLIFAVPAYARFSRSVPRNRLIVGVTMFFASNLLVFYGLVRSLGSTLPIALSFYLWIGVFNMMIVAQFWAFANDLYTEKAGERLFPLLGLGASLGAVGGAATAKIVLDRVGPLSMMLLAAVLLLASAAATEWVHWREVRLAPSPSARATAVRAIGGSAGAAFRTVMAQRYLLYIAVFSVVFTLVKTNGDYLLSSIVKHAASRAVETGTMPAAHVQRYIASFFAGFDFKVDVLSLALQAFVVSRFVKYIGVRIAFFVLPFIALADAATMAALPLLAAVSIGKTAESGVDYSLNNTVRNILWLPTSRRAKYLAKQATDTFFVRMGDVASAIIVLLGTQLLGLSIRGFALVNVALVGVWLLLARAIVVERGRLPREPDGEDAELEDLSPGEGAAP
jgi:AAA family ATP:ADP antiporter